MEIIPEFATPRDSLEHVFLIWNSSATLRRALAHIVLLQLRYVAHLPILPFFSYVTSRTYTDGPLTRMVHLHGWSTYTDGPLTRMVHLRKEKIRLF